MALRRRPWATSKPRVSKISMTSWKLQSTNKSPPCRRYRQMPRKLRSQPSNSSGNKSPNTWRKNGESAAAALRGFKVVRAVANRFRPVPAALRIAEISALHRADELAGLGHSATGGDYDYGHGGHSPGTIYLGDREDLRDGDQS